MLVSYSLSKKSLKKKVQGITLQTLLSRKNYFDIIKEIISAQVTSK